MPKYRALSADELQHLEKEFVEFLVINGITADEWVAIKEKDRPKAFQLTELFSNVVFEKLMRKTEYVIKQVGEMLMCFHYGEHEATLIIAQRWNGDKPLDGIEKLDLDQMQLELSEQTKKYQKSRESELFDLIEGGAEISDGEIYRSLRDRL